MVDLVEKVKTCPTCGISKNVSNYSTNSYECKPCGVLRQQAYEAKKRREMGDEAYRAMKAEYARNRRKSGPAREQARRESRITAEAVRRLVEAHQREWKHLRAVVRREMTDNG